MKGLYLALSGGGAHAAAHAGVLRALEREKVPVAGMAGVSGGALVAGAWAGGADLERLVEQASRLHPWMWVRGWGGGLLSGSRARRAHRRVPARTRPSRTSAFPCPSSPPTSTPATPSSSARGTCVTPSAPRAASPACSRPWCWRAPPLRRRHHRGDPRPPGARHGRRVGHRGGRRRATAGTKWPGADSFVAIALRAGLTLLRGSHARRARGRRPRHRACHGRVGLDAPRQDPGLLRGRRRSPRRGPPRAPAPDRGVTLPTSTPAAGTSRPGRAQGRRRRSSREPSRRPIGSR